MNRSFQPTTCATILLITGAVMMLLAVLICPGLIGSLLSYRGVIPHMFTLVCALIAAQTLRNFAEVLLRQNLYPWYIRRGTIPFYIGISFLMLPILAILSQTGLRILGDSDQALAARLLEFLGAELFFIVFLDWPVTDRYSSDENDPDSQSHQSCKPRFIPLNGPNWSVQDQDTKEDCRDDPF
jgi:hypothetical protein